MSYAQRALEQMVTAGVMTGETAARVMSDPPLYTFEDRLSLVYDKAEELLLKKHKDYGPKNIADAPGGPLNGLRVRMYDKLARINNLVESGAEPENESLRDSFMDLVNYGIIGLLVLDGHWPGAPE